MSAKKISPFLRNNLEKSHLAGGKINPGIPRIPRIPRINGLFRKGIALPMIMGVVFCTLLWIAVLFQGSSQTRHSIYQQQQSAQAYYFALGGFQHLFLKIKEQSSFVNRLIRAEGEERTRLLKVFAEDLTLEIKNSSQVNGQYRVESIELESGNPDSLGRDIALKVKMLAIVGNSKEIHQKTIRIRRN